ncbi:hypothetical protein CPB83DRAFT_861989 [Crepidotus variabilis]|uniref:Uncharacterized protein n=1 Tax=Crepidotus variabilis TaxID=179855 RepID=A0A9P6E777_9AGAR|nr:hypothetical protein CPB83DRAFT_861989 [Crepidotus variabilis]
MDTLPEEIVELFIKSIDKNGEGRKVMCACMSVSRRFFRPARSRLFSSVEFDRNLNIGLKLKHFRELLEYNSASYPPLGPCIKSLTLDWPSTFSPESVLNENEIKGAILLLLAGPSCNIIKLSVNFGMALFPDPNSDYRAYHAFRTIFSVPSLQSLSLSWVRGFPSEMINIFKIQKLHTVLVQCRNPQTTTISVTPPSTEPKRALNPQLREVVVLNAILPQEWFQDPETSPFSRLESLSMHLGTRMADNPSDLFDKYLTACQHTLKNLKIHLIPNFSAIYPHSLQQMTELRKLTYIARYGYSRSDGENISWAMKPIIQSLATMVDAPLNLQHIVVCIPINLSDHRLGHIIFGEDKKTSELMDTLSSRRLESVEKVEIVLHLYGKQKPVRGTNITHPLPTFAVQAKVEHPRVILTTNQTEEYGEGD